MNCQTIFVIMVIPMFLCIFFLLFFLKLDTTDPFPLFKFFFNAYYLILTFSALIQINFAGFLLTLHKEK